MKKNIHVVLMAVAAALLLKRYARLLTTIWVGALLAVGFFSDGFLRADGHLTEVVVGTIVDVEVDIALDAWEAAHIGMLPELPGALVFE